MVVHTGQLQIEEQHALPLHAVVRRTVRIPLPAPFRQIALKAVPAELAQIADILSALHAELRLADRLPPVKQVDDPALLPAQIGNRLGDHVVVHLRQALLGIQAQCHRPPGVDSADLFAGLGFNRVDQRNLLRAVPVFRRCLGHTHGIVIVKRITVRHQGICNRIALCHQVHPVKGLRGEIPSCFCLLRRDARNLRPGSGSENFFQWG